MRRLLGRAPQAAPADTPAMGIRMRGLDIGIKAKQQLADGAARAEAKADDVHFA